MSAKRQATSDINRDNWDHEEPPEEMGMFQTAPPEDLQKRVIRTAKRRFVQPSGNEEAKKGVFSGFGGFNKTQPSSFDFLANLTNGNKAATSPGTTASSSLFNSKPLTFQSTIISSSTTTTTTTFGISSQPSALFGASSLSTQPSTATTIFTASKADSTVKDSPFKIAVTTSNPSISFKVTTASTSPKMSSSIFSGSTSPANKSVFGSSSSNSAFKIQQVTSLPPVQNMFNSTPTINISKDNEFNGKAKLEKDTNKQEENRNKMKYYANLKALNEAVLAWIKKHVEETPLCILTPIFKDYEKYLADIQEQYEKNDSAVSDLTKPTTIDLVKSAPPSTTPATQVSINTLTTPTSKTEVSKLIENKPASQFASNLTTSTSNPVFGLATRKDTNTTSPGISPFTLTSTVNSNASTPFSFGIGKPFSFSPNVKKPADIGNENKAENEEESDEPPKVEFTPVVEENSIFEKRCKVFVKKDETFADKGVGTLYIKKLDSGKHQLLVRANTNLGAVLLNLILASGVPLQRMGKNNVMLVCIPTPDSKPPPVPVLIRVKTNEEADELLETLNKYKS